MEKDTLKQTIETDIEENTDSTADYMDKINQSFFLMLKNPTDKEIEKHRKIRDALIALWLASLFKDFEEQLYNSAQKGIDEADKQLKAKNITEVKEKSITVKTFEDQVKSRLESFKSNFAFISEFIKANSERAVKNIKNNILATSKKEQKVISTEIASSMGKIGCTYFIDSAGRKIDIKNYTEVKTLWDKIQAMRMTFFTRAIQYGVDLAKIIHLNIHPHCELCIPFENKVLSLTGKTEGYMTVWEAEQYGLFHPFCDHIPDDIELAPEDVKDNEKEISLNEANKKRYEYNKKRGFSSY
nr:MAG TPA: minor capsid protein [Caudoviricetes sp.]